MATSELETALNDYRRALERNYTMTPTEVTIVRPKFSPPTLLGKVLGSVLAHLFTAWLIMLLLPFVHPSLATFSYVQVYVAYVIVRWLFNDTNYQMWSKEA